MSAALYNPVIDQGSDWAIQIVVKDDNDVVQDLTGYSARSQMRRTKNSDTVAGSFSCTIPVPENGTIHVQLPNATSSAMTAGYYKYDLEIFTAGDAVVDTLLYGTVNLRREVTR
jgi:hypothetical protein